MSNKDQLNGIVDKLLKIKGEMEDASGHVQAMMEDYDEDTDEVQIDELQAIIDSIDRANDQVDDAIVQINNTETIT